MLDRRAVLRGTLAVATLAAASGHTPYRQWSVYRQKHLLIGCCRADPPTYPLAKRVAGVLAEWLPESRSRVSRAPDQERLASLITTGQLEVMLFSRGDATALNASRGCRHEPPARHRMRRAARHWLSNRAAVRVRVCHGYPR